jgi:hypothetical protein
MLRAQEIQAGRRFLGSAAVAVALAGAGLVGGCGGSGSSTSTSASTVSVAVIAREAGFQPNDVTGYTGPAGCDVAEIFNTQQEIDLYRSAGDTVVTDPTGTIGAKVIDPGCVGPVANALLNVDLGK